MDTTANRLNLAMEMRNMKAVDLSEKTGIGKSSISQYRNGIVNPKQDRIYLMAQALNVNEMWLMGHDVPMERQAPAPPAAQPPTAPYRAPLTERDERDIEKRLQAIRDDLDADSGVAFMGGQEMTDTDKEYMMAALESGIRAAKLLAKKYTPKKYRKDGGDDK